MAARAELAHAYRVAGQPEKALPLYERLVTDQDRAHGPDHPDNLAARGNLAHAYRSAGRMKDALGLYRRTLGDRERVQGRDHLDTIAARGNLADTYFMAGKYKDAIPLYERTLADRERTQGPSHLDTIAARGNLASAYHSGRKLAGHPAVRAEPGRLRASAQSRPPGHADVAQQPRTRITRWAGWWRPRRCSSARSPIASARSGGSSPHPDGAGGTWKR
jgi:tetratricopeptide (TPR) repeat protein